MIWIACLIIAALFIAVSVIIAIAMSHRHTVQGNIVTPFNTVFFGLFVAAFVLMLPVYNVICEGLQSSWFKAVLFSLHGTFQIFTVDADSAIIAENITAETSVIAPLYSAVLSVIFVIAPIFTFGFVASFFKNFSAYIRLSLQRHKDIYVFSELNEKSLVLATDIRNKHPKAAIVFTDVYYNNEEESYELIGRVDELGGICFKKDVLAINLHIHSSAKQMFLFVVGNNESENISHSLKLIKEYGNVANTHLYVFTTGIESELLLTHNQGMQMKVRRINEVRSLINRVLYERGSELFGNALPINEKEKKIHAVILGLGMHGTEMLKSLVWFCQMDGYRIEIDAYDKDPLAEEKFTSLCPELMSPNYNGVHIDGESEYTIRIHSGIDVSTMTFAENIKTIKDATYAFVALGSDEINVQASVTLRMLFERSFIKPVIHAVVNNPDEKAALTGITNYRGQQYNIACIGDLHSSFSEDVIINSELEKLALQRHLKWGKEEEFWQYEYNYNSSMASAIHMQARIICGIPGANKSEDDLTDSERHTIEVLEHRRWNAYMRSEGYIYSGSPDKSSRNDLAKMHHDLVDFSALTEEEKRKDSKVGSI